MNKITEMYWSQIILTGICAFSITACVAPDKFGIVIGIFLLLVLFNCFIKFYNKL